MVIHFADKEPIKNLPLTALILSILFHGAVMSLFIFVFPYYQSPSMPIINFLGSSLSTHEFMPNRIHSNTSTNSFPPINFLETQKANNTAPFNKRTNAKPPVARSLDPDLKTTLKSTFLEAELNKEQEPLEKNTLFNNEPYIPLKLNQQ